MANRYMSVIEWRNLWQIELQVLGNRMGWAKGGGRNLQLLNELLEVALGRLLGQDVEHLLADVANLASLRIAR